MFLMGQLASANFCLYVYVYSGFYVMLHYLLERAHTSATCCKSSHMSRFSAFGRLLTGILTLRRKGQGRVRIRVQGQGAGSGSGDFSAPHAWDQLRRRATRDQCWARQEATVSP